MTRPPPREDRADAGSAGPLSLLKRQVYLVALPLTLLAVLLTLALDAGHPTDLFNRVALPLLAGFDSPFPYDGRPLAPLD